MWFPPVGQASELGRIAYLLPGVSKYGACIRKTPCMVPASVKPMYDVGICKSPRLVPISVKLAVWRSRSGHSFVRRPTPKKKKREEGSGFIRLVFPSKLSNQMTLPLLYCLGQSFRVLQYPNVFQSFKICNLSLSLKVQFMRFLTTECSLPFRS